MKLFNTYSFKRQFPFDRMFMNPACHIVRLLVVIAILTGCDDDDVPKGKYEHGTFILNEGNFGGANGTITYFDESSGELEQNIFRNSVGEFAGDVVQSISFEGDNGYLVINGENKIEVIDANTFTGIKTIADDMLDKPRYVQIIDNKAYVSVLGPYDEGYSLVDSYVLVIDLATNAVLKKIETDEGTENLLYAGAYLFASNYDFGASNTVAVIDPADNTLVDQITVGAGPSGSVIDANGKIWVICIGDFGAMNGQLVRINPETLEIEESIDLNINPDTELALTPDQRNLIYSSGADIYKLPITATAGPADLFFTVDDLVLNYSLGVDPDNGDIYVGDAFNYITPGKVYVYSESGTLKTSFETGISPTQFVFK